METALKPQSTLNRTNFCHFLFVFLLNIASFFVFDLTNATDRSFAFYLFFVLTIAYTAGRGKITAFEFEKTVDYGPTSDFSSLCLCWWVAITDYIQPSAEVSKYTGFFLLFALLATFNLSANILLFLSDKAEKEVIPMNVIRPTQLLMLLTLSTSTYFFVTGNWSFGISDPFSSITMFFRGY